VTLPASCSFDVDVELDAAGMASLLGSALDEAVPEGGGTGAFGVEVTLASKAFKASALVFDDNEK
jgi:hypothetical protein